MALEKTLAAAQELQLAAQRVITKQQNDAAALAQALTDVDDADTQAAAAIQPTIDALNSAVPPPAAVTETPTDPAAPASTQPAN